MKVPLPLRRRPRPARRSVRAVLAALAALAATIPTLIAVPAHAATAAYPPSNVPVLIKQNSSGLCIEIPAATPGNNPQMTRCDPGLATTFTIFKSPTQSGQWRIQLASVDACLSVIKAGPFLPEPVNASHDCHNNGDYDSVKDWYFDNGAIVQTFAAEYPTTGCLDTKSMTPSPGTTLLWATCEGNQTQGWTIVAAGAPAASQVMNPATGQCMTIDSNLVHLAWCAGLANQMFYNMPVPQSINTDFQSRTVGGVCLAIASSPPPAPGAQAIGAKCWANDAYQGFRPRSVAGGGFLLENDFGWCLSGATSGAPVVIDLCNANSVAQVWSYGSAGDIHASITNSEECVYADGWLNGSPVRLGSSATASTGGWCYAYHVAAWHILPLATPGQYLLRWAPTGPDSGMCVDTANAKTAYGSPAVIGMCTASQTQTWSLSAALTGKFQLINVGATNANGSKTCLDVAGSQADIEQCLPTVAAQQFGTS